MMTNTLIIMITNNRHFRPRGFDYYVDKLVVNLDMLTPNKFYN